MNQKWRRNFLYPIIITCIATSIIAAGGTWLVFEKTENSELSRRYYEVDGMTCIVLTEYGVSCNWEEWNGNENPK